MTCSVYLLRRCGRARQSNFDAHRDLDRLLSDRGSHELALDLGGLAGAAGTFGQRRPRSPRLAQLLDAAEDEVLAYLAFPQEHWRQVWSNNSQEMASSHPPLLLE